MNRTKEIEYLVTYLRQIKYLLKIISIGSGVKLDEETIILNQDYSETIQDLRVALVKHFQWEKENNIPVNLTYRRLYKDLKLFY